MATAGGEEGAQQLLDLGVGWGAGDDGAAAPAELTSPSSRSVEYARSTVCMLMSSEAASSRAEGSRSPGVSVPSASARRTQAATCSCRGCREAWSMRNSM